MTKLIIEIESGSVDMDLGWLSALLVGAGCLAIGYFMGTSYPYRIFVSPTSVKHGNGNGNGNCNSPFDNNKQKKKTKEPLDIDMLADVLHDFKMVLFLLPSPIYFSFYNNCKLIFIIFAFQILVVRNDLKMGKGKIAAQCRYLLLLFITSTCHIKYLLFACCSS